MNSYVNSQVNFLHEIHTKLIISDKLGKVHMNLCEFVKVMLQMACTVFSMNVVFFSLKLCCIIFSLSASGMSLPNKLSSVLLKASHLVARYIVPFI